ncbi:MAG: FAD-binding oxidoreductase, partial [Actinomycetota bacterium]|nr:FAD-binding oxidoreductase [Actinomycetota bacterium]
MTIPERLANRDIDPSAVLAASDLPERARVVVVGGGIIGASIAYHLTREGETDVVIVERGRLSNGTTWHAAGLVSQVRGTHALTELSRIST